MALKIVLVFLHEKGYNKDNLKCSIKLVSFEPTFTFMGFLYCRVAVKPSLPGMPGSEDWKGRQKSGCGYPPSAARSQKTRRGISGKKMPTKDKDL